MSLVGDERRSVTAGNLAGEQLPRGYMILGLMYGPGDLCKSLLTAVTLTTGPLITNRSATFESIF